MLDYTQNDLYMVISSFLKGEIPQKFHRLIYVESFPYRPTLSLYFRESSQKSLDISIDFNLAYQFILTKVSDLEFTLIVNLPFNDYKPQYYTLSVEDSYLPYTDNLPGSSVLPPYYKGVREVGMIKQAVYDYIKSRY